MRLDHDLERVDPTASGVDSITIGGAAFPGALNLPSGPTATRTTAPVAGSMRWNTQLGLAGALEVYDGTTWNAHLNLAAQAANTVLAGPLTGTAVPTFRLQALTEHSDVVITSPVASQTLTYNGANWVNSSVTASNATGFLGASPSAGGSAWVLDSGTRYAATFTHNLGTSNVVVTVYDSTTNSLVIPDQVTVTDGNTLTVKAIGNTKTLKVVVVANGQSLLAQGSPTMAISYQGVNVSTAATRLNFIGSTVVADVGSGTTSVSIGARFINYANSFDTPNNADWVINAFAPTVTDPTYPALNVRSFPSTTETGVGFSATVPLGVTQATYRLRGRAQTAPATASVVQYQIYMRAINANAAVGAWTGPLNLTNIAIPTNAFFQVYSLSAPIAAAGITAGVTYQFELVRRVTGVTGTNLPGNFLLAEAIFEFA